MNGALRSTNQSSEFRVRLRAASERNCLFVFNPQHAFSYTRRDPLFFSFFFKLDACLCACAGLIFFPPPPPVSSPQAFFTALCLQSIHDTKRLFIGCQPALNLTCLSSVAVPSYSRESINALYSRIIIQIGIFCPLPAPIPSLLWRKTAAGEMHFCTAHGWKPGAPRPKK